jgi:hypothetical protein
MDRAIDTELIIRTSAEQPGNSTVLKIRMEKSSPQRCAAQVESVIKGYELFDNWSARWTADHSTGAAHHLFLN